MLKRFLLAPIVLAAIVGCAPTTSTNGAPVQSPYARAIEAGKIRAAFAIYEPLCMRNAETGELQGIGVDILKEAGQRLSLDVEWTEEVGWGTIFEGLQSNRYEVFGAGVWQNGSRGRVGIFSIPMYYNAIKVWGSAGDELIDDLSTLNRPDVRISTQDGAMDDLIAKSDFPDAQQVSLPQLTQWSDVLLNITTGKADITFAEPSAVNLFLEHNPGTLRELHPQKPVRVFPTCFAFKQGAFRLKAMIDSAMVEMHNDGTIDRIVAKYEASPGAFYRLAVPYNTPE